MIIYLVEVRTTHEGNSSHWFPTRGKANTFRKEMVHAMQTPKEDDPNPIDWVAPVERHEIQFEKDALVRFLNVYASNQ